MGRHGGQGGGQGPASVSKWPLRNAAAEAGATGLAGHAVRCPSSLRHRWAMPPWLFPVFCKKRHFCDVSPLAICSRFLPGAKQVLEDRGSANRQGARPGPPHFGAGRQDLVSTPHLGRHSEAKATCSGISWLPALSGQAVPSVPGPGHHWGLSPGAGPTLLWTSGQTATSPHPLLTLLAPSSHQEPQRALRA